MGATSALVFEGLSWASRGVPSSAGQVPRPRVPGAECREGGRGKRRRGKGEEEEGGGGRKGLGGGGTKREKKGGGAIGEKRREKKYNREMIVEMKRLWRKKRR